MSTAAAVRTRSAGLHTGQAAFECTLWSPAPAPATGWRTLRDTLFFPRGELDTGERTVRYLFQRISAAGTLRSVALCEVPYTRAALRRADRRFGVEAGGGTEQFTARQGMMATMGCVGDGKCVLEPIVVTAPPTDDDHEEYDGCELSPASCAMDDGDTRGGGGGSGPVLWAVCVLTMVGSGMTVADVADQFQVWYDAYKDAQQALRMWRLTVENNAAPVVQQLYEYQYNEARRRQEDAANDVSHDTKVSYVALALAAGACSASVILPTP